MRACPFFFFSPSSLPELYSSEGCEGGGKIAADIAGIPTSLVCAACWIPASAEAGRLQHEWEGEEEETGGDRRRREV